MTNQHEPRQRLYRRPDSRRWLVARRAVELKPGPGVAPVLVALLLAACAPRDPAAVLQEAEADFARGDNRTAVILVQNLIEDDPDNAAARLLLGRIAVETGDSDLAELQLEAAGRAGARPEDFAFPLAEAQTQAGKTAAAATTLELVPDGDALQPYWLARARIAIVEQRYDAAQTALDRAEAIGGETAKTQLERARIAAISGDLARAGSLADAALALAPDDADVLAFRGAVQLSAGRAEAAEQDLERAAGLFEARSRIRFLADTLLRLVQARLAANQVDAAADAATRLARVAPNAAFADYANGLVAFQRGNYDRVIQLLRVAITKAPRQPQLMSLLGAAHLASGNLGQAEQQFLSVLEITPADPATLRLLAETRVRQQRPEAALDALADLDTSRFDQDVNLLALEGIAHLQAGRASDAIPFLEQANSLTPGDQRIVLQLARAYSAAGRETDAFDLLTSSPSLTLDEAYAGNVVVLLDRLRSDGPDAAQTYVEQLARERPDDAAARMLGVLLAMLTNREADARSQLDSVLAIDPDFVPARLSRGILLAGEGRLAESEGEFERVLGSDSDNIAALMSLAQISQRKGDPDATVDYLKRAAEAAPIAGPKLILARLYASRGEVDLARQQVDAAVDLNPDRVELLTTRAIVAEAAGDRTGALESLETAWSLSPTSPTAALLLAQAQDAEFGPQRARETLSQAVRNMPAVMDLRAALGLVELEAGNPDEALGIARDLQVEFGRRAGGYALEGEVHWRSRRYDDAASAFRKAYERDPTWQRLSNLLSATQLGSDPRAAEDEARAWLDDFPADARARLYLADRLADRGDVDDALGEYKRVAEADPTNVAALNNVAWYSHVLSLPDAETYAQRAVDLDPDNAATLDTLGWILTEDGRPADGLKHLQSATELAPQALEIRYHLAVAQALSGDTEAARTTLDALLADPEAFAQREAARTLRNSL